MTFLESLSWGTSEAWVAIGTIGLFIATCLLVYVGRSQVISLRKENAKWRTLSTCERYDTDPILHMCLEKLRELKTDTIQIKNKLEYKIYLASVLNYFDGIAIGIAQGLYNQEIVEDHLKHIINVHVETYLSPKENTKQFGLESNHYGHLLALYEKWNQPVTTYKDGWFPSWKKK